MSRQVVTHATEARPSSSVRSVGLLQRTCTCGRGANASGECEECRTKRIAGLQKKLRIGSARDPLEREADAAADMVMRMPNSAAGVNAHAPATPLVQRRASAAAATTTTDAPSSVHDVLRSPGAPLDRSTRAFFEPRFGHDFSRVRVHADSRAAESASAVRARAYTVGEHIVFGTRQFAPGSATGRSLLAHELAHTIQQGAGGGAAARYLARKPNDAGPQHFEVIEAPPSTDPSEAPWFVWAGVVDQKYVGDRKALLPKGTLVVSIGAPQTDVRGEKKVRVVLQPVKVLAMPPKHGDLEGVVGKRGSIRADMLTPVAAPEEEKKEKKNAPKRYSPEKFSKRKKSFLWKMAQERARQQQTAATVRHMQVTPNVFGGFGGPAHLTAQVIGQPIAAVAEAAAEAAAEAYEDIVREIKSNPLYAFGEGLVTGVQENLDLKVFADNVETFVELAVMWNLDPRLQLAFFKGTGTALWEEIKGLVELVTNIGEIIGDIKKMAEAILSEGGAEVTRAIGYQIGSEWAKRMTEIAGMTDLEQLATALGETFGPLLLEVAIGVATMGGSAAASVGKRIAGLLSKFPKLAKLLERVKEVRGIAKAADKALPEKPGAPTRKRRKGDADGKTKRMPEAEKKSLKELAKDPDNVKAIKQGDWFDKGYDAEIAGDKHTYRRKKDDRTWCRFENTECDLLTDAEFEAMIDSALTPEPTPQKGARVRRPKKIRAVLGEKAREEWRKNKRDGYMKRLRVKSGEDIHHAIELQVLDRYPGVFDKDELNALKNMRGIPEELAGKKQFHNSKLREVWDRHYVEIDDAIAEQGLKEGTEAYRTLVRRHLLEGRKEIDHLYEIFFAEVKREFMP